MTDEYKLTDREIDDLKLFAGNSYEMTPELEALLNQPILPKSADKYSPVRKEPRDSWLPGLVRKYGAKVGISRDEFADGQVRYRKIEVEGTPGVWISSDAAFDKLMMASYSDAADLSDLLPSIDFYHAASAA